MRPRVKNSANLFGLALTASIAMISQYALADIITELEELKPQATSTATAVPSNAPVPPSVKPASTPKPAPTPTPRPAKIDPLGGSKSGKDEEIHYWSNGGQLQMEGGVAELEDNVVVTKGDMRLESKKAKVYFKQKTSEITKVVAVGDVRLQKHDPSLNKTVRAQGDEATFYNLEQRVIVRGNARLWRGPDLMRGRQINYDLKTGTVTIEQVEGVVQPGKKD